MPDLMTIVGVWEVHIDDAPFPHHVMTFHADGTMSQSNPDQGNRTSSDSTGMGNWHADGDTVSGAFLEFTVAREDPVSAELPRTVQKGIVRFTMTVRGDEFIGTASATFHDLDGTLRSGPMDSPLRGNRFRIGLPEH